jgi:hypothetical protein
MVEVVAERAKVLSQKFIEESAPWNSAAIVRHNKFLKFFHGEWAEEAAARAGVRSVEDALEQQVRLVGSRKLYDKINASLASNDPLQLIMNPTADDHFFLKEKLLLFKWRVDFMNLFFPGQAGWVTGPGPRTRSQGPAWWRTPHPYLLPVMAQLSFHWTLEKVFHMLEDEVVDFEEASPLETPPSYVEWNRAVLTCQVAFNFIDEDEEEEEDFLENYECVAENMTEEVLPLASYKHYLERVVRALHSLGPPSLRDLASRRVLELDLPTDELPREVREEMEAGPQKRELTQRGDYLLLFNEDLGEDSEGGSEEDGYSGDSEEGVEEEE